MAQTLQSLGLFALHSLAATALPDQFDQRHFPDPRQGAGNGGNVGNSGASGSLCPAVWDDIRADLWPKFQGCSRSASFAIRFAFHDAATTSRNVQFYAPAAGGADGSLLLNDAEAARGDNDPLDTFRGNLTEVYNKYHASSNVSAADIVQFAGSLGTRACAGGPLVRTWVGRKDSSKAAPEGLLPAAFGPGADADSLIGLFEDKGISAQDLAALIGAHSVSQSFAQQANGIPTGGAQDSTPTEWDTLYYSEVLSPQKETGVFELESDTNLAEDLTTKPFFERYAESLRAWNADFAAAMEKLSLLGIPQADRMKFIDCTSVIAGSYENA